MLVNDLQSVKLMLSTTELGDCISTTFKQFPEFTKAHLFEARCDYLHEQVEKKATRVLFKLSTNSLSSSFGKRSYKLNTYVLSSLSIQQVVSVR